MDSVTTIIMKVIHIIKQITNKPSMKNVHCTICKPSFSTKSFIERTMCGNNHTETHYSRSISQHKGFHEKSLLHLTKTRCLPASNYCNAVLNATGTIFAVCSGYGKCGVSVVRVSGTQAGLALKKIGQMKKLPKPRTAIYRRLVNADLNEPIDRGLVMWFPGRLLF